ncbi:hypothetical protein KKF84_13815, partial [Myxococcota bacterium]|nr:hypothetical protein [Myxococcota bacterium]
VEIKGKTPVTITTHQGKYVFAHPTISRLDGDTLVIAGGNRGSVAFPLNTIQKTEVEQYNWGKTMLVYTLVSIALCIPLFIWIGSSSPSDSDYK